MASAVFFFPNDLRRFYPCCSSTRSFWCRWLSRSSRRRFRRRLVRLAFRPTAQAPMILALPGGLVHWNAGDIAYEFQRNFLANWTTWVNAATTKLESDTFNVNFPTIEPGRNWPGSDVVGAVAACLTRCLGVGMLCPLVGVCLWFGCVFGGPLASPRVTGIGWLWQHKRELEGATYCTCVRGNPLAN